MELRIEITEKNKERVFALVTELLKMEQEPTAVLQGERDILHPDSEQTSREVLGTRAGDLLLPPPDLGDLGKYSLGRCSNPMRAKLVGSWGQFNSFYPIKAACRIAANMISRDSVDSLRLDRFVQASLDVFKKRNMRRLRGFPSSDKATAEGRYVWHFLTTACEMGFLTLKVQPGTKEEMPESFSDWNLYSISVSDIGLEFAKIENDVIDKSTSIQILNPAECELVLGHMKEIDSMGYCEYSVLSGVYDFLRAGHNGKEDLRHWFENNPKFCEYVASWSRKLKPGAEDARSMQLSNLASTFAASKIALLRELRLVSYKRNSYDIVGDMK